MRFRKSNHSIYRTEYHLVWIPRYRRKIFVQGVKQYAEIILQNVPQLEPDIEVLKLNVQLDHVHMVIVVPPRVAVANVVQYIKTRSAKMLKAKFPFSLQFISWYSSTSTARIGSAHPFLGLSTVARKHEKLHLLLTTHG